MGHTYLARAAKAPEDAILAVRNETPIPESRLESLRRFAQSVVAKRCHVGQAAVEAFIAAEFTQAQVLDVVTIVAVKTISNYVNHIAHTAKESFMSDPSLAWSAPAKPSIM